jgi:hypothetical protein
MSTSSETRTPFEWRIFADATCAGLAVLIPLPGLDLLFEMIFRHHMPRTIARHRQTSLPREIASGLGASSQHLLSPGTCLALPLMALFWFIKRLSRKIVYIFTIKEAAQQLSSYWHRAYLIDHVFRSGHLDEHYEQVLQAFHQTMREADTDSLTGIARQVVASSRSFGRSLLHATRRLTRREAAEHEALLQGQWHQMEQALMVTVGHYEQQYQSLLGKKEPEIT